MSKKVFTLFLAILMFCSSLVPVFSTPVSLNVQLDEITRIVKNTLGIKDEYSTYYGELIDSDISQSWSLSWSNDVEDVNVGTDSNGKIFRYYNSLKNYDYSPRYGYYGSFSPIFPKISHETAMNIAMNFLDMVLDSNESVEIHTDLNNFTTTSPESYYFNGTIKINGVHSPFNFSISVRTSDLKVSNFYRSTVENYLSDIPSNIPNISSEYAKIILDKTISLNLEYVVKDSEPNSPAVLRYLPVHENNYFVDASTGKLIDKTKLFENINNSDLMNSMEGGRGGYGMASSDKLSDVELDGIAKLKDVLPKEELDTIVRNVSEIGISNLYTLSNANYSINRETDNIYCYMTYSSGVDVESLGLSLDDLNTLKKSGSSMTIYKYLTLDAKTGEIISLSTGYPYLQLNLQKAANTSESTEKHISFLETYQSDKFSKCALYSSNSEITFSNIPRCELEYAQIENGYFLASNNINIMVNKNTGMVDYFYTTWVDDVTFEHPNSIVSLEDAHKIYADTHSIKLSYINIPVELMENAETYKSIGYNYLLKLCLGYTLENSDNAYAIDAATGNVLTYSSENSPSFTYSDINNCYAKEQIETLALYGIGFEDKTFKPNQLLTQRDMLIILLNSLGYKFDASRMDEATQNRLYSSAYVHNLISPKDNNPTKVINRCELVKTLLIASGYGRVASLSNIYKSSFKDESTIPAEYYGYVAIAQGMGIVVGDLEGNFNPYDIATRAQTASIIYNFMSRTLA